MDKTLVIGGNGKTGSKVIQKLQQLGQHVQGVSRTTKPSFDWENQNTWPGALHGMDKIYITYQPDLAVPGSLGAIEALTKLAGKIGVRKLVLLSGKGEREAQLCEQIVIHSGIDYTVVRASWFSQNFSESFLLEPILAGHVALPKSEAKVPFVDTDDISDVVVQSLIHDDHGGKIYELTGPRLLTFKDVIQEIAKATGRSIQFTPISSSAYVTMLQEAGIHSDYVWLINYLFTEVLGADGNEVVTGDIERVLRRKPKDFSTYVQETAKTGVWNP